jgi:hypothetical protein
VPGDNVLRVVVVRKGKVKSSEFRLRPDEIGLSLFLTGDHIDPNALVAAVRGAGKQGDLAVAEIPADVIHHFGLVLVSTPGGTPDPDVNALHVEARPSWWRRLVLRFRRETIPDWFNKHVAPELAATARLIE